MKVKTNNQKGFGVVEIILVILTIGIVGCTGWFVWKNNQHKTSNNSISQDDNPGQTQPLPDPWEGGKYLVIMEWKVRFPLPKELRGAIKTYVSGTEMSGSVLFASESLNNRLGDDTCDLVKQPDGSISGGIQASLVRIDHTTYPADTFKTYGQELNHIKKIGEYDYYSRKSTKSPPITCLTNKHEELNDMEQSISKQLNKAFEGIESI